MWASLWSLFAILLALLVPASAIIPLITSPPTVCLVIRMHSSSVLSWICVHVLLPSNLSSGGCHLPVPPLRSPTPLQGRALPFSDSGFSHRLFSPHVSPRHCCAGDDLPPQALAYPFASQSACPFSCSLVSSAPLILPFLWGGKEAPV